MQFPGSENLLEFQLISKSVPLLTTASSMHKGQSRSAFRGKWRRISSRKKKVRINFPSGLVSSLGRRKGVRRLLWPYAGSRKLSFDNGNGQGFTAARNRTGVLEGS